MALQNSLTRFGSPDQAMHNSNLLDQFFQVESHVILSVPLEESARFEEEDGVEENRYTRTLEELRNFKAAGDPFTEDFFQIFQFVYMQQMLMLEKL
ncbi:hypothetical protein RJ640_003415 [Escallonia rubra]|uniref:Uncharacterized protein n=1 Tax=Escallonia rubra TaxID=112253 RepID=A0AA88RFH4_9ASTE|nr:hypothetical protein RJ640_003415 [Escallonia rubra]